MTEAAHLGRRPAAPDQTTGRVLVVEDEPGIAGFVRRGLQFEGFAVEVADDGRADGTIALDVKIVE